MPYSMILLATPVVWILCLQYQFIYLFISRELKKMLFIISLGITTQTSFKDKNYDWDNYDTYATLFDALQCL